MNYFDEDAEKRLPKTQVASCLINFYANGQNVISFHQGAGLVAKPSIAAFQILLAYIDISIYIGCISVRGLKKSARLFHQIKLNKDRYK